MSPDLQFRLGPGDLVTRADLAIAYGGSPYSGGIVPSNRTNAVFVFTDPQEGRQFGYVYDGFSADGSVLYYTGAGQDGDQVETGSNSPIVTHVAKGRTLHAFVAGGRMAGTTTKLQRYIGEFVLDPLVPSIAMPAPDRMGAVRTVLVFRLLPVTSIPDEVVDAVGHSEISDGPQAFRVPVEINSKRFFETAGSAGGDVLRRESLLVDAFIASQPDHNFGRWAITLPAEKTRLLTDVYDENDRMLYEAKAIASRNDLRLALGQLYDYRRHVPIEGLRSSVLLPNRPAADLCDLLWAAGLGIVYQDRDHFSFELTAKEDSSSRTAHRRQLSTAEPIR